MQIRSFQLVQDGDSGNAIAVIVVSCVAFVCLVLLASLLVSIYTYMYNTKYNFYFLPSFNNGI